MAPQTQTTKNNFCPDSLTLSGPHANCSSHTTQKGGGGGAGEEGGIGKGFQKNRKYSKNTFTNDGFFYSLPRVGRVRSLKREGAPDNQWESSTKAGEIIAQEIGSNVIIICGRRHAGID